MDLITDAEYEAAEKLRARMGKGVPPFRELSADESKLVHAFAAKAVELIPSLISQLDRQTAEALSLQEELETRRQVQQQSMGLGPERVK